MFAKVKYTDDQSASHLNQVTRDCYRHAYGIPTYFLHFKRFVSAFKRWLKVLSSNDIFIALLFDSDEKNRNTLSVGVFAVGFLFFFARWAIHMTNSQNAYSTGLMTLLVLSAFEQLLKKLDIKLKDLDLRITYELTTLQERSSKTCHLAFFRV